MNASLEEPTFILTQPQIEEMLKAASCKAQESIISLQDELRQGKEREAALNERLDHLEENQTILFGIIAKLKASHDLQPAQQDRAEVLRSLLLANGGKMFAKDARQRMRISKSTFSVLLSKMEDEIDKKPYHLKKNQIIISLK